MEAKRYKDGTIKVKDDDGKYVRVPGMYFPRDGIRCPCKTFTEFWPGEPRPNKCKGCGKPFGALAGTGRRR